MCTELRSNLSPLQIFLTFLNTPWLRPHLHCKKCYNQISPFDLESHDCDSVALSQLMYINDGVDLASKCSTVVRAAGTFYPANVSSTKSTDNALEMRGGAGFDQETCNCQTILPEERNLKTTTDLPLDLSVSKKPPRVAVRRHMPTNLSQHTLTQAISNNCDEMLNLVRGLQLTSQPSYGAVGAFEPSSTLKDNYIPEGYLKFRFNEDCSFPKCTYRNHQSHFHCDRNDCHYSFCDKTRFVQHTARHKRLDKLMGDDFKQFRVNMSCGFENCEYYRNNNWC